MKTTTVIISILVCINLNSLNAQDHVPNFRNGKIGITFSSFGETYIIRFERLEGDASYDGDRFRTLGISYVYVINRWLGAETGIEYSRHSITIHPNLPPDMDYPSTRANLSLINIPVTLRANFLRYFYVNGGLVMDIDSSLDGPIDNQTGIGSILGFSLKYDFHPGISVFLNPYAKVHSLLPFSSGQYHQRLWENGIRIGLTYDLRK